MAGRIPAALGYFSYVSRIEPTAYGCGSTISAAPARFAASHPAPKLIPPCVSVGPSSTTRARFPLIRSGPIPFSCRKSSARATGSSNAS